MPGIVVGGTATGGNTAAIGFSWATALSRLRLVSVAAGGEGPGFMGQWRDCGNVSGKYSGSRRSGSMSSSFLTATRPGNFCSKETAWLAISTEGTGPHSTATLFLTLTPRFNGPSTESPSRALRASYVCHTSGEISHPWARSGQGASNMRRHVMVLYIARSPFQNANLILPGGRCEGKPWRGYSEKV